MLISCPLTLVKRAFTSSACTSTFSEAVKLELCNRIELCALAPASPLVPVPELTSATCPFNVMFCALKLVRLATSAGVVRFKSVNALRLALFKFIDASP
ncbi:hypothetical protein CKF54_01990 [Psittacicella hinzii]|uniref:Uncharacterized protein n=2 Tax=Psittacicella hinzii TaxID=2028575 RepID=A0A3A1Y9L7_9GAMM|nr:hypothetical protein CKF54_01990 [Psittacicella hinzii]